MIKDKEIIKSLVKEISNHNDGNMDIYLIGGGALMYYGAKLQTKDLDLIAVTNEEFEKIVSILKKINFSNIMPTDGLERVDVKAMMKREDIRIDLFHTKVCRKLSLSESMISRCRMLYSYNNVHLHLSDIGDILIFKCITDRTGDIDDCINLIKQGIINWDIVLTEIVQQIRDGDPIWITYITEKMHIISKESMIEIPILKKLDMINDEFIKDYLDRHQ